MAKGTPKPCPSCGEELFTFSIFPFTVYLSRLGSFYIALSLLILGTILAFDIPSLAISHIHHYTLNSIEEKQKTEKVIEDFPQPWKDLYFSMYNWI